VISNAEIGKVESAPKEPFRFCDYTGVDPQTCGRIVPFTYSSVSVVAEFGPKERALVAQRIIILAAVIVVAVVSVWITTFACDEE
jgi:hypothetical protein